MFTLTAHELGHFIQAWRYGVPASLPYFIPMPFSPIGTMGAVIAMRGGMGNRKSLFDIGITGPLAGLAPAFAFCLLGLWLSDVRPVAPNASTLMLGEPLIFKLLSYSIFGPLPAGTDVFLHPIAYAGWVGVFITALNLIPIGQLDGGHVLYALLRRKARFVSTALLLAAVSAMAVWSLWGWSLMILFLLLIGPNHPPTANDEVELGFGRTVLGYLTLPFVFIGFTPTPFMI
jgi:membrane-associated protease RseP (regulator of RpoE activity)